MKYLRLFKENADYQTFLGGGEYIEPHVVAFTENTARPVIYKRQEQPKPKVLNQGTIVVTMPGVPLAEGYIQWQYPVASHVAVFIDNNHVYTTPGLIKSNETVIGDCDPIVINVLTDEGLIETNEDDTYIYQVKKP